MKTYLNPEEVDDICYASDNLRDRAIMLLLRDTGIRVSELISVKREGLDLGSKQMFIRKAKIRFLRTCPECRHKSGQRSQFCPQCGINISQVEARSVEGSARRRIVSFTPQTARAIRDYLEDQPKSSWLFPSPRDPSKPLNRRTVAYLVQRAAEEVGLGGKILDHPEYDTRHGVSPHRIRDAMAIGEFREDSSLEGLRILAHKLGHRSPETTYAHYIKIVATESNDADRKSGSKRAAKAAMF